MSLPIPERILELISDIVCELQDIQDGLQGIRHDLSRMQLGFASARAMLSHRGDINSCDLDDIQVIMSSAGTKVRSMMAYNMVLVDSFHAELSNEPVPTAPTSPVAVLSFKRKKDGPGWKNEDST